MNDLLVISPNGGEVWPIGSTQVIRWKTFMDRPATVVDFQLRNEEGPILILARGMAVDEGIQIIEVPDIDLGPGYKIRIFYVLDMSLFDQSDETFTISPKPASAARWELYE